MAKKKATKRKTTITGKVKGGLSEIHIRITKGEGDLRDTISHACATEEEAYAFIKKNV